MADCHDIWGTRSGSKHTQELGQVIARFFMFIYNKEERMGIVNELVDTRNVLEWSVKYNSRFKIISEQEQKVLNWNYKDINNWLNSVGARIILVDCTYYQEGIIKFNGGDNKLGWSKIYLGNFNTFRLLK